MTTTISSGGNSNPPTFLQEFLFDRTNYFMFKDQVTLAAKLRYAEGYLEGTIPMPTPKTMVPTSAAMEWWDLSLSYQEWLSRVASLKCMVVSANSLQHQKSHWPWDKNV